MHTLIPTNINEFTVCRVRNVGEKVIPSLTGSLFILVHRKTDIQSQILATVSFLYSEWIYSHKFLKLTVFFFMQ